MIRTLLACLVVLGALAFSTAALTRGFSHWTFEAVRRADAHEGRLAATRVDVVESSGHDVVLWGTQGDPGAILVVDFVYTNCITVCQVLGPEFAQMQAAIGSTRPAGSRLRLVSLSLDVERDGRDELAGYARRNGADAKIWTVAAPRTPQAATRLMRQLGVIAIPDGFGGFVHNGTIHVIDGRGVVHGIYDTGKWRDALDAASALAASKS
jgi:protein SCO1/2